MRLKISFPRILFFVMSFSALFMIISSSFFNVFYDDSFYEKEFEKFKTYDKVLEPLEKTKLLISYFSSPKDDFYQPEYLFSDKQFTQEEINHLQDVKYILQKARNFYLLSLVSFFVLISAFITGIITKYSEKKKLIEKISLLLIRLETSLLTLCVFFLFIIGTPLLFCFNKTFTVMHQILFPNGNFTFPPDSLLITLFPKEFFFDFAISFVYQFLIFLGMLIALFLIIFYNYRVRFHKKDIKSDDEVIEKIFNS